MFNSTECFYKVALMKLKPKLMYKYSLFLEWIRSRPNAMAFLLNCVCPICNETKPVLIKSPTSDLFYCGKCWRVHVDFEESIKR